MSGLAGRRVSLELADRFVAMISELRAMDDMAGGGTVLLLAEQEFGMVATCSTGPPTTSPPAASSTSRWPNSGSLRAGPHVTLNSQSLAQRYDIAALRDA